jgi:hypothetical protein
MKYILHCLKKILFIINFFIKSSKILWNPISLHLRIKSTTISNTCLNGLHVSNSIYIFPFICGCITLAEYTNNYFLLTEILECILYTSWQSLRSTHEWASKTVIISRRMRCVHIYHGILATSSWTQPLRGKIPHPAKIMQLTSPKQTQPCLPLYFSGAFIQNNQQMKFRGRSDRKMI